MRCAAFTVTAHGIELAEKMRAAGIGSVDVFVKEESRLLMMQSITAASLMWLVTPFSAMMP